MLSHRLGQSNQLPGGGLPFYKEGTQPWLYAHAKETSWFCPSSQSIPFQVAGPALAGLPVLEVYRADTGVIVQPDISGVVLSKKCLSDGREIITNSGNAMGLGPYNFWIKLAFGTDVYISDIFEICNHSDFGTYMVEWSDTRAWVGGCYYGDGYKNRVWIRGAEQRPKIDTIEEFVEDGYGVQKQVYSRVEDGYGVEFFCSDSMLLSMSRIVLHNDVKIQPPGLSELLPVRSVRVADLGEKGDWLSPASLNYKNQFAESQYNGFDAYEVTVC